MLRRSVTVLVCATALATVAATAGATTSRTASFRTPSGNIGCMAFTGPTYLRCDIRSGLRPNPVRPKNCHLDYGDALGMTATGRSVFVCHGDTVFDPKAKVLAYGKTFTFGPFHCSSQPAGLACRNRAGHGWLISRQSYRRF